MTRKLAFLVVILLSAAPAVAQVRPARAGMIDGVVTTQGGTIRLGGAQVVVQDGGGRQVTTVLSEGDGHFSVVALPEGRYRVTASLAGFETGTVAAVDRRRHDHGRRRSISRLRRFRRPSTSSDRRPSCRGKARSRWATRLAAANWNSTRRVAAFRRRFACWPASSKCRAASASKGAVPARRVCSSALARWLTRPPASHRSHCQTMPSIRWRCCRIRMPWSTGASRQDSSSSRLAAPATSGRRGSTTSIPPSGSAAAVSRSISKGSAPSARGWRRAARS